MRILRSILILSLLSSCNSPTNTELMVDLHLKATRKGCVSYGINITSVGNLGGYILCSSEGYKKGEDFEDVSTYSDSN